MMILYLAVFVIGITILAFLAMRSPTYKRVQLDGGYGFRVVKLPNAIIVIIIAVLLIAIAGHRGFSYQDTGSYVYMYRDFLPSGFVNGWKDSDESAAFWGIAAAIREWSGVNESWFLLIFSILTIGFVILTFYKYSERFEVTLFMYLTLGSYLLTMNAMRQCIASAIVFLGYRLFIDKRWVWFFLLVGIAYFFHPTSLIMIPIYFYCHRPAWQPIMTIVTCLAVLVLLFFPSATQAIFSLLGETKYSQYETSASTANIARPLVMTAMCFFAYVKRDRLRAAYPYSDVLVNILIVHTVMLFAATNSWVFARLCIFTDLYVAMLVPMLIIAGFDKKDRTIGIVFVMLFFMAYHLYEYRGIEYYSKTLGINY